MFIAPFLGVLRGYHPDLKHNAQLGKAVEACKNGVGCGKEGFDKALQEVESELQKVSGSNSGINEVLNKVKEVNGIKSTDDVRQLANGFKTYFKAVLDKVVKDQSLSQGTATEAKKHIGTLNTNLQTLVTNVGKQNGDFPINVGQSSLNGQQNGLHQHISPVNNGSNGALKQLYNAFNSNGIPKNNRAAYALSAAAYNGVNLFVTVLQTDYTSYYKGATWQSVGGNQATCAKTFLACLPLLLNGLSYFYWKCSDEKGWKNFTLGSPEPKAFMGLTSIGANRVKSGRKGSEILSKAFENFNEFSTAARANTTSYADFLKRFKGNCINTWKMSQNTASDTNFLSGLYLCSTSYFRHQHQKRDAQARAPSSIREMLYWLMGLTATPQFGDLLEHIDSIVPKTGLQVAVSGSSNKNERLFADDVAGHLITTCFTATPILLAIQGTGDSSKPWLHELFATAEFTFAYPASGSALFNNVSNYTYALQFQLTFLYKQCADMYINTSGWYWCNFGKNIKVTVDKKIAPSHICPAGCATLSHNNSEELKQHMSGDCEHTGCGSTKPSALQAFLIDALPGFSRTLSGQSGHLAECSGPICHVPMGFTANDLRDSSTVGAYIHHALKPFLGSPNTPLRQLCGTLTCLSKRAPRSLGDLFGFYWQVTGQLFNDVKNQDSDPSSNLKGALSQLLKKLSTVQSNLLYQSLTAKVESIGNNFFGLSWHCHWNDNKNKAQRRNPNSYCKDHDNLNKACDLMSLYDSECPNSTCGKYLEPLGISSGATFADKYAFTYLSWAAYLTDELSESLQNFFDAFDGHTCTGCNKGCSHPSGLHSSSHGCRCTSIVHCADALPLLYTNGFSFKNALSLKQQYKRQCSAFAAQLKSVIFGNPLSSLLTSIDDFLYAIRWEFFSKLSGFWTIYIGLILYTFFFLLDTLHLRSHLKLTSSHMVPPLALLTQGTPLPITKLTYIEH